MISRYVNQLQVVPAFVYNSRFAACGSVTLLTCAEAGQSSAIGSSQFWPGLVIDRAGLTRNYNSVALIPVVYGDFGTSGVPGAVADPQLSFGIEHTSATGGTWAAYSTQNWVVGAGLWRQTTATSTANLSYSFGQLDAVNTSVAGIGGIVTTATSTASGVNVQVGTSSTGFVYYAGPPASFSLGGAKRYIRSKIKLQWDSTGDWGGGACAVGFGAIHMSAAMSFGEPGYISPPAGPGGTGLAGANAACSDLPFKRILVTSACAT